MGKREAKIEDYLQRRVKEEGGEIRKVRWIGRRGAADRLVWWSFPRVAWIECKAEGEEIDLRSLQGREFRRMRRDGWPAYIVSTHAQVDAVIELVKSGLAT